MKVAPIVDVKTKLSSYIEQCQSEPVVVTKNGYVRAALIPVTEDDIERLSLAFNPRFQKILKKSYTSIKKTGGISHDDFWNQVRK